MRRVCILFGLLIVSCPSSLAQNPNLGTAGAQFLKIPVDAKAAAMGGAVVGLADDASAVFWNPAGIVWVDAHSAQFTHMRWFDQFDVTAAAYAYSLGDAGALAIGIVSFGMDALEVTTETSPNGTGLFFDAQDIAIGVTYARRLTDQFVVGLTGKYVNQRIWNESASGFAFDVGTQYRLPFRNLTIAMSMRHFGPDLKMTGPDLQVDHDVDPQFDNRLVTSSFETEAYPLPLTFEFGVAIDAFENDVTRARIGVDALHPNDNRERMHFGGELGFFDQIFLRGGYKLNHDDELFDLGFGVKASLGELHVGFDYAFSAFDILPDVHMFSAGLRFE